MERGDGNPRQRAIIYASSSRRRRHDAASDGSGEHARDSHHPQQRHGRTVSATNALSVPNWFDLPLILPEPNPIGARVQRGIDKLQLDDERTAAADNNRHTRTDLQALKVSHLSPTKDMMRQKLQNRAAAAGPASSEERRSASGVDSLDTNARTRVVESMQYAKHQQHFAAKSHQLKKRRTTHGGAAVVLDRIDRKSRLREKIWRDLSKFGLWYFADESPDGSVDSVDNTVDAIMQQWDAATAVASTPLGSRAPSHSNSSSNSSSGLIAIAEAMAGAEPLDGAHSDTAAAQGSEPSHAVFLTALPSETAPPESLQLVGDMNRDDGDDGNEDDNEDAPEDDDDREMNSQARVANHIRPPGMKRRQRLKELHYFVEKQLQKRLFKSWDTIEIALAGSGDLTASQIVKFLQHSDVQLSAADAAKVQAILNRHTRDAQTSEDGDEPASARSTEPGEGERAAAAKSKPATVSFSAFHRIFYTKDTQEAVKWRREFDREKIRQRQEKAIYEKELAALEEKVKKRLAESAHHMIDVLAQFRVDPLALPWESESQRLELRTQLFETIFTKPQRRQLLELSAATASDAGASLSSTSTGPASAVPTKLSAKIVESALLTKYSRNGHFDAIEVDTAAYVFHDFVVDCIKASVRRFWLQRAADAWPERQLIFQFRLTKQVFFEWRRFTKHAETLRRYVLRKFVAWKYLTRQLHAHYAFIRVAFWPFYVWKRHLQQQIIARGKSAFLANVMRTYVQLRHFRALKARYQRREWNTQHLVRLLQRRASKLLLAVWDAWKTHSQARIHIHRLWKSRGHVLQRLHKLYMVKITFVLWRYIAILKKDMRRRQYKCLLEQFTHRSSRERALGTTRGVTRAYAPHGASWYPHASGASLSSSSSLSSPQMLAKPPTLLVSADEPSHDMGDDVDTVVDDSDDDDASSSLEAASSVSSLTRIMETELGQRMKRKGRLYDLCLALYLKYREKDRRAMVGNVIMFRRTARALLAALKNRVEHVKKHRFATDLGAFRVLHARFRQWMLGTFFKEQLGIRDDDNNSGVGITATDGDADSSDDDNTHDVDPHGRTVLHWRRDREWRLVGIEQNPLRAQQLVQDLHAVFASDAQRADAICDRELTLKHQYQAEDAFLRKEAGATLKVRSTQLQQAQQILRTRGHRMHDVLDRVYDDLLRQRARQQLRSSFRSLRVVVMLKYTAMLCRRAQLRNWLRLCQRLMYWERHAAALWRARTKFHAFQSLLKHAVWKWQWQSPGLSAKLQQRRALAVKYDHFLERRGLLDGSDAATRLATTKFSPANSCHGLFLRWVQFTQFTHAARQVVALERHKRALAQLQSVFTALRIHVKGKYTLEARRRARPFLLRQAEADLDAYHCKLLTLRARLPTTQLRQTLVRRQQRLVKVAAGSPTLKQLFQEHEVEVRRRLSLENRLMFSAYTERKVHHYAERSSPLFGAPVGRAFMYEMAPPYGSISDIAVICGKQVDGISLVVKTNASVTHEGALYGNPFGTRDVFSLARGEVLVSIEGFASQTLYSLRFGTSTGRLSKWYGHCDKGTKFEIRSDFSGTREEIVGLFGYADGTSLHALGAVLRHTTLRNIFEGLWLHTDTPAAAAATTTDDAVVALCDRQFAYFLQVRMCDVLNAMKRAHRLALRVHRATHVVPPPLARLRVVMGLARWLFNALAHGLVHSTSREDEGKRVLQDGMNKRASGEKSLQDGLHALEIVDSFRDEEQQLNVATLGVKKITELREMMEKAQQRIASAKQQIEDGQREILAGRCILPHLPMTKRMMTAIRRMYRVVQTKDYIDQMDPDVRAILLVGDGSASSSAASLASSLDEVT